MEVGSKMAKMARNNEGADELNLNLNLMRETELCLGLPGGRSDVEAVKGPGKRGFSDTTAVDLKLNLLRSNDQPAGDRINGSQGSPKPPSKAQVVGWPPVRSYRKNTIAHNNAKLTKEDHTKDQEVVEKMNKSDEKWSYVKVCMDGAPYLRKVDLKIYSNYQQFYDALTKMLNPFTMGNCGEQGNMIDFMKTSEYVPTYQDKDGDWMLVGDVPWTMFVGTCKRVRIMKGSDAIALAPIATEKRKNRS